MRKLEEHFCSIMQSQELIKLGCNYTALAVSLGSTLRQVPINYKPHPVEIKMFLRSQALDFFRDKKMLGEIMAIDDWNVYTYGIWLEDCMSPFFKVETGTGEYITYHEAESALIDKLIELEMEVQNGK